MWTSATVDYSAWGGSLNSLELIGRIVSTFFLFAFGACVGSFLNVVVYRLPAGLSVVTPPSRCPLCGGRLSWRENLPVIGWLLLRGRCKHCREPISIQYPLIETLIGCLFAGTYLLFYASPSESWLAQIGGGWWRGQGFAYSWPAYIAFMFLFAGLIAMTLTDARTFTIPIEITRTVTLVGLAAAVVQPLMPTMWKAKGLWFVAPLPGWVGVGVGIGGAVGALLACLLLALGRLPVSFADYDQFVKEDDPLSSYPHARREMGKELRFVAVILLGCFLGWLVGRALGLKQPPLFWSSVGSSCLGFVVGGGIVWTIRILGSYAFNREAMGMGDVHLLAAVGAVLGWRDSLFIMGMAPIVALAWVFAGWLAKRILKLRFHEIPLGPHLAVATFLLVFLRPALTSGAFAFMEWEQGIVEWLRGQE